MRTPLQVAPGPLILGILLAAVAIAVVGLWRMEVDGAARPDVRELPDGTRLSSAERAAVVAAREHVVDEADPVDVAALREEVYPDHSAGYRDARDWWTEAVGPALDHDDAFDVPHDGDQLAASGPVEAVDDDPGDPAWFPDASPPAGERFGHALNPRWDRHPEVQVSDGQARATLRIHGPQDVRVTTWQGEDVDLDWLADAREHVRRAVDAGELPAGDDGDRSRDSEDGVPRDDQDRNGDTPDGNGTPTNADRDREREPER